MSPVYLTKEQVQEIGALLKSSREQQGENLAEVAFRIALSPSQLRAIEAGDLRPFYSTGYFLQAAERYANFLNIELPQHSSDTSPQEGAALPNIAQKPAEQIVKNETAPQQVANTESKRSDPPLQTDLNRQTLVPKKEGRSWGWLALGAAAVITIGIVKISLDKSPATEATLSATATSVPLSAMENESKVVAPSDASKASAPAAAVAPAVNTSGPAITASAPAPVSPTTPERPAISPAKTVSSAVSAPNDSLLELQAQTWVQLVKTNGEKNNIKAEPGQKIEFASTTTAAVVFGQPDKAVLKIKDKTVNLKPFISVDNPTRALVILNQIRD